MNIFKRLHHEEGMTIVLVTHDPEVGSQTEHAIHVKDGRLEEQFSAPKLYAGIGV